MSKVTDFSEAPALTLWQPYAHVAAIRLKGFETRGWETWHRGQLFIHAAKRWDREQEALWRKTCVELLELDLSETATYRPGGIRAITATSGGWIGGRGASCPAAGGIRSGGSGRRNN